MDEREEEGVEGEGEDEEQTEVEEEEGVREGVHMGLMSAFTKKGKRKGKKKKEGTLRIGGLDEEIKIVRQMVGLPLTSPHIFETVLSSLSPIPLSLTFTHLHPHSCSFPLCKS